jgi:hypothetical protein
MMTLSEYFRQERELLDQFLDYWSARSYKDPKTYPIEMTPGEWDEQFEAWRQANAKEKC